MGEVGGADSTETLIKKMTSRGRLFEGSAYSRGERLFKEIR